jgi:hypothetical protein
MSRQNLRGTGQPHQITDPGTRLDRPFLGGQSYRQVPDTTRALLDDPAEEWDGADATLLPITRSANRRAIPIPVGRSRSGGPASETAAMVHWLALYRPRRGQ